MEEKWWWRFNRSSWYRENIGGKKKKKKKKVEGREIEDRWPGLSHDDQQYLKRLERDAALREMFLPVTGGENYSKSRADIDDRWLGGGACIWRFEQNNRRPVLFSRRDDKPETDLRFHLRNFIGDPGPSPFSPIVVRFRFFYAGFELMGLAYGIYGSWKWKEKICSGFIRLLFLSKVLDQFPMQDLCDFQILWWFENSIFYRRASNCLDYCAKNVFAFEFNAKLKIRWRWSDIEKVLQALHTICNYI